MRFSYGLLATCALGLMGAAVNAPTMQIRDAWVRWLPGNLPAGGYVTLINSSDRPISLITASSPDYALVSMHRTRTAAGISQMLPVDKITVDAHSTVEFGAQGIFGRRGVDGNHFGAKLRHAGDDMVLRDDC